jgi:hypothetical protein
VSESITVSGICPEPCGTNCPIKKSERAGLIENPPPPKLYTVQNQILIGILTGAMPDCRPQPGRTLLALRWSVIAVKPSGRGEGQQEVAAARLLTKLCQNGGKT